MTDTNRSPPDSVSVTSFDDSTIPPFSPESVLTIFSLRAWRGITGALTWIAHELQAIRADVKSTKSDVGVVKSTASTTNQVVEQIKVTVDKTEQTISSDYTNIAELIATILTPVTTTLESVADRLAALESALGQNPQVLLDIRAELDSIRDSVGAVEQDVHAERDEIDQLFRRQFTPVSGRIVINGKEPGQMVAVHPTDTLAMTVVYQNAEHQAISGTVPTSWTALAPDGVTAVPVSISVAAFPDDEGATATPPLPLGSFVIHAQLQGASFEAVSEQVDVAQDNVPTSGVVNLTVTPVA